MTSMQRYTEALLERSRHRIDPNERELENVFERAKDILGINKKKNSKKSKKSKSSKSKSLKSSKCSKSNRCKTTTTTSQPSTSSTVSSAPQTTSSPEPQKVVDCDTGENNKNFVGIISSGKPITALGLDIQYDLETDEDDTDVVEDDIASEIKDSLVNYLANELFPVCAADSNRQLVSTSFGTLHVERKLEPTGLYIDERDGAEVIGKCNGNFTNTNCFVLQDTLILFSDGTNDVEKNDDFEDTKKEIKRAMKRMELPQSVDAITFRETNLVPDSTDPPNNIPRTINNSSSNTPFIAIGASVGALLCIVCACVMAKFQRGGKNEYNGDDDSQRSRNYSNQVTSFKRYQHVHPNHEHLCCSSGGGGVATDMKGVHQSKQPSGYTRTVPHSENEMEEISEVGSNTEEESAHDEI